MGNGSDNSAMPLGCAKQLLCWSQGLPQGGVERAPGGGGGGGGEVRGKRQAFTMRLWPAVSGLSRFRSVTSESALPPAPAMSDAACRLDDRKDRCVLRGQLKCGLA